MTRSEKIAVNRLNEKLWNLYGPDDSPANAQDSVIENLQSELTEFTAEESALILAVIADDCFGFDWIHQAVSCAVRLDDAFEYSSETLTAVHAFRYAVSLETASAV